MALKNGTWDKSKKRTIPSVDKSINYNSITDLKMF